MMSPPWRFRMFALGGTATTDTALANFEALARQHLPQGYELELVDLHGAPELARENDIVAVPTLMRLSPSPVRRVIGDLSQAETVVAELGLNCAKGA